MKQGVVILLLLVVMLLSQMPVRPAALLLAVGLLPVLSGWNGSICEVCPFSSAIEIYPL